MKLNQLLKMSGYVIERQYVGKYGFPAKKRYYYMLVTKSGDRYRLKKKDVQMFIKKGTEYKEIN